MSKSVSGITSEEIQRIKIGNKPAHGLALVIPALLLNEARAS